MSFQESFMKISCVKRGSGKVAKTWSYSESDNRYVNTEIFRKIDPNRTNNKKQKKLTYFN